MAGPRTDATRSADAHIGGRLRLARTLTGTSQEALGAAIGLTFQQIQKYEKGANRISASRLLDLARTLNVPVTFFFDGLDGGGPPADPAPALHRIDSRDVQRAAGTLARIGDTPARRALLKLIAALEDGATDDDVPEDRP